MLGPMSAVVDPYAILGVSPSASTAEVRAAYRRRVAREHADLHADDPTANERTRRLNLARDTLLDPARRARLDAIRHAATPTRDPLLDAVAGFGAEPSRASRVPQPAPIAPAAGWLGGIGVGLLAIGAAVGAAMRVRAAIHRQPRSRSA